MTKINMQDPKALGTLLMAVVAACGVGAGFVTWTTPEAQECQANLREVEVRLAGVEARLELLTEAKNACKEALDHCSGK